MKPEILQHIRIRRFAGVRPNERGVNRKMRVVGFDIETAKGVPYCLALYGDGLDSVTIIRKGEGLLHLLRGVVSVESRSYTTIATAHNLRFDFGVLLADYCLAQGMAPDDVIGKDAVDLEIFGGSLSFRVGNVCFASFRRGHRSIHFVDTYAYFKTSLVKACADLGIKEKKLRHPKGLGYRKFPLRIIRKYARQDALLVFRLGKQIVSWWEQYGIRPAISAPQMAGRIFTHKYVRKRWVKIPRSVNVVSLLSYHGGRNGFYTLPGWYKVHAYDLVSAYSWAMTQIPPMQRGRWEWQEGPPPERSWGFVVFTGAVPFTKYPLVYSSDFRPLKGEYVEDCSVTTMEYDLLKEYSPGISFQPEKVCSVVWHPADPGPSDLSRYARDMFLRKKEAQSPTERTLFKLLANSLYGKFIARTPDGEGGFLAGQLFYPPVASWITALVRCKIIRLEYQYKALHTATDGIMVPDLIPVPKDPDLGELSWVNSGPALILRNKLYLHFDFKGELQSYALHGFQGNAKQLWSMVQTGRTAYTVERLTGWREARRRDSLPYAPVKIPMRLHIPEVQTLRERGLNNPFRIVPNFR